MNEQQTKRRLWQIHLSTTVIISLAAGAIIFKNTQLIRHKEPIKCIIRTPNHPYGVGISEASNLSWYGWPFPFRSPDFFSVRNDEALILDLVITLLLLASCSIASEWLIRRGRKP